MVFSSIPVYLDPQNWHQVCFSSIFFKANSKEEIKKQIQKINIPIPL